MKVYFERAFVVHRQWAARQYYADDAFFGFAAEGILVVGYYFAVDVQLAYAATDKLCGLRAEVENHYFLLHKAVFEICAKLRKIRHCRKSFTGG